MPGAIKSLFLGTNNYRNKYKDHEWVQLSMRSLSYYPKCVKPSSMITTTYQFMVDLTLPEQLTEEFAELIPYQQLLVDQYLEEGKLVNYALSNENNRAWAVFNAKSELEVLEMLAEFPLTPFMGVEVSMLASFNTQEDVPQFSLN
jgi:muconolactone delta-isomerase